MGTPPSKNRVYGGDSPMGIDLSPSAIVAYKDGKATIEKLAPSIQADYGKIRRIQRAIDRSLRVTNPDCYEESGVIKRGAKFKFSHRCQKLKDELADKQRHTGAKRRQAHEILANAVIAQSSVIRVEDTPVRSWQKRAKKTTVNKKNGKINSKKRYGKTIAKRAPAMLLSIIDRKLKYIGKNLIRIDSRKVKASQFDHTNGTCRKKKLGERWTTIEDVSVQRDLYSAFLISNVEGQKWDTVNIKNCKKGWATFLKAHEQVLKTCNRKLGIFG